MASNQTRDEDIPTQIRVRTDPGNGYGSRYRTIQRAKNVFDVGNNTDAIVRAAGHATEDAKAKREAINYLAGELDAPALANVVQLLSTPQMPLAAELEITSSDGRTDEGSAEVSAKVGNRDGAGD